MPFVTCPECQAESLAPRELIGLVWDCPKCNYAFTVGEDGSRPERAAVDPVRSRRRSREQRAKWQVVAKLVAVGTLAIVTATAWCARAQRMELSSVGTRTNGDLVQHFDRAGLNGKYTAGHVMRGEKESGFYVGDGFSVVICRFDEQSQAESLEKSGTDGYRCYRNGRFVLIVHRGGEKVVPIFSRF